MTRPGRRNTYVAVLAACLACSAAAAADTAPVPVDYVVLLDHAAGISEDEQDALRDAALLPLHLASPGDGYALVLCGKEPRTAYSAVLDGEERAERAGEPVCFDAGGYDLPAGLEAILADRERFLRTGTATPVLIIMEKSGLLTGTAAMDKACGETLRTLGSAVPGLSVWVVSVDRFASQEAESARHQEALPFSLPRGRYYGTSNAASAGSCVFDAVKRARGACELGAESGVMKMDGAMDAVTLFVNKVSPSGELLHRTDALVLRDASGREVRADAAANAGIEWRSASRFFDLIRITQPAPGVWQVASDSGTPVHVRSMASEPSRLQTDIPGLGYTEFDWNWAAWFAGDPPDGRDAWVRVDVTPLDERNGRLKEFLDPMRMPRCPSPEARYLLRYPDDWACELQPGRYEIEVTAHDRGDEFFFRRLPRTVLEVRRPFAAFASLGPGHCWLLPLKKPRIPLRAEMARRDEAFPQGMSAPAVECVVAFEPSRGDAAQWVVPLEQTVAEGDLVYTGALAADEPGVYSFAYRITFTPSHREPFMVKSATGILSAERPNGWLMAGIAGVALLVLVFAAIRFGRRKQA